MYIQAASEYKLTNEYGCHLRRLFPWKDIPEELPWGGAWSVLEPGNKTKAHWHDEDEIFIIVSGNAVATNDGENSVLQTGDLIYFPRFSIHSIKNTSETKDLKFIALWWGWKGEDGAEAHFVDE